jgi:hypothetical protein
MSRTDAGTPSHKMGSPMKAFGRAVMGVSAAMISIGTGFLVAAPAQAATAGPLALVWSQTVSDGSGTITASSPNVGNEQAPGGGVAPAVVVGDLAGNVYAYNLSNGSPDWTYPAGGPVQSTPSVGPSPEGNSTDSVYVGVGDAADPHPSVSGYQAIDPQGKAQWGASETDPNGTHNGVQASLAVGDLQGGSDVTAGSLGQDQDALNASSGAELAGFPWFQGDSNYSTPALASMYGNGTQIVEGGAGTTGNAYGFQYEDGGYIRVVSQTGNLGQSEPNGGTDCSFHSDEEVDSSPAVGEFFGTSLNIGIVVGTGSYYAGASDEDKVIALTNHCVGQWESAALDGTTAASPALADVTGNGQLDVIEGTNGGSTGSVYALNGANGQILWQANIGPVDGGVATVDLGEGYQDVIAATSNGNGVYVLDGRTGAVVQRFLNDESIGFQNTPLVTEDPNGTIGVTVAGYQGSHSVIDHYEVAGSNGAVVHESGAWPQFHHDPQLTGDAGTTQNIQVPCKPPAPPPYGYRLTASDGGVFDFGNLPFCGSTGGITLNQPVVGMANTTDGGGYWLVASDGGIFAFGDAGFYGSMGSTPLNKPIVGMAASPDGKGYWLVASDGGIFSFGDAKFHGSTGNITLNKPIVGMAATPDGLGYWLVASDGGIFSFGDAKFHGSTGNIVLNKPVVGMAATSDGGGYWLVASDGGIFSFGDAKFHGSMGGKALNAPIVGMQATADGLGYRFVASDGGIFDFGSARFYGSMGGKALNKPIVAMAGY